MTSLTSTKIPVEQIKRFYDFLQNIPKFIIYHPEKNESFRGKYNNLSFIMVYATGTITFLPNCGVEELITTFKKEGTTNSKHLQQFIAKTNRKYDKNRTKTSAFRKYNAQELRVKLTRLQLQELKKLLDGNSRCTKLTITTSSMLGRYKLNNQVLTLY